MDPAQKLLIDLLSSAIREKAPAEMNCRTINLKAIYRQARLHAVHTLLFPLISKLDSKQISDSNFLPQWQKSTILHASGQIKHIHQASKILEAFNKSEIPTIILKGLVLRDLYPTPELRIMGDADIFIHPQDLEKATDLLSKMGYKAGSPSPKHIVFYHKQYPSIEIHWTLVDSNKFKKAAWFDKVVWDNAEPYEICGIKTLILSKENEVLHVSMHMAGHLISGGFGLRQLSDLVLLLEDKKRPINWNILNDSIKACGLECFFTALLKICHVLFNVEIPKVIEKINYDESAYMDDLLNHILTGGVFGRNNLYMNSGNLLLHYTKGRNLSSKFKAFLSLLFPATQKLPSKYSYARKYRILLPLAWIHRLVYIIVRKDFTLSQKKAFLPTNDVLQALDHRTNMLEQLDLQ